MINKTEIINQTIYDLLIELNYEVHYISPSETSEIPYLAFNYEEVEECLYALKIESWIDNIDLVGLDDMLDKIKDLLDKKIIFNSLSYRFYFSGKDEIMQIEGSNYIGRTINFEMRII